MLFRSGGYRLVDVEYYGTVILGMMKIVSCDYDWNVIAILVPVTKSELIGEGVWSEVLIFGRGMDAMR